MRRMLLVTLILLLAGGEGCTLTRRETITATPPASPTVQRVTATLSGWVTLPPPPAATVTPSSTDSAVVPLDSGGVPGAPQTPTSLVTVLDLSPTVTVDQTQEVITLPPPPSITSSPRPTDTPISLPTDEPTTVPTETLASTPIPQPTRVATLPPTLPPLDDGSGRPISGTGTELQPVQRLPETLYFLSNQGTPTLQVWRLRYGLALPEQLTSQPAGIALYDVAPNGTLAYVTASGELFVGGVPLGLPVAADGSRPQVTSLAWSPAGTWLAYTLHTPSAAQNPANVEGVDGLWLRGTDGNTFILAKSIYYNDTNADAVRIFTGPLDWRPDGGEILAGHDRYEGRAYSRINLSTWVAAPVWNAATLLPDAYQTARWSVNGNAIITSGAGQVLRVEPENNSVLQTFVGPEAGLWPEGAQQFADGTVIFLGGPANPERTGPGTGSKHLLVIRPGQSAPIPLTDSLTETGAVDFLWDNLVGQEILIVVYEPADSSLGEPYLRSASGVLNALTPTLGLIGAPQWGPTFKLSDAARVNTTAGDPLNLRAVPGLGGQMITALADGTRVTILDGPRVVDGYRWWQVRTNDGIAGWAAEINLAQPGTRMLVPTD